MALKVIGAGHGRTGTLSLKAALEELGFGPCYHMVELLAHPERVSYWEAAERGEAVSWNDLFEGYAAGLDFPVFRYYDTLAERYPDAKIILTVRDPERWYESALNTIYRAGPPPLQKALMAFQLPFSPRLRKLIRAFRLADKVWQKDFGGRFKDKAYALAAYKAHNERVKQLIPPDRLLVYEVSEGWEPLCAFLGVPVPDKPFPRLNDRLSFKENQRRDPRDLLKAV